MVGFITFQFSAHGGQSYKRISLESSLNLVIWPPSAIVLYPCETLEYWQFLFRYIGIPLLPGRPWLKRALKTRTQPKFIAVVYLCFECDLSILIGWLFSIVGFRELTLALQVTLLITNIFLYWNLPFFRFNLSYGGKGLWRSKWRK